jgi:hypothetical protein
MQWYVIYSCKRAILTDKLKYWYRNWALKPGKAPLAVPGPDEGWPVAEVGSEIRVEMK